jgi:hypothetical protein
MAPEGFAVPLECTRAHQEFDAGIIARIIKAKYECAERSIFNGDGQSHPLLK